ncbi:prephenate dehydratase domain-containing protein [Streptomyces sp. AP-93]|uniref:prephenate dehydratase domain-containing protein n=1 Tax=Streptomyces sp. AP-93 TaxID=2929048 RepID=UPI0027E4DB29|nr:prephenate dehydratase domain-containing protein [Streptomyces sp. AP-93]
MPATLKELVVGYGLWHMQAGVQLPVTLHLVDAGEQARGVITTVLSHPHAHAQCRKWLDLHMPDVDTAFSITTADAARMVADGRDLNAAASGPPGPGA